MLRRNNKSLGNRVVSPEEEKERLQWCYAGKDSENFTVGLTNVHPLVNGPQPGNYDLCGQYPGQVPRGATVKLHCQNTDLAPARYVVVHIATLFIQRSERRHLLSLAFRPPV